MRPPPSPTSSVWIEEVLEEAEKQGKGSDAQRKSVTRHRWNRAERTYESYQVYEEDDKDDGSLSCSDQGSQDDVDQKDGKARHPVTRAA